MNLEVKKMELIENLLMIQDRDSLNEIGRLIKSSISKSSGKDSKVKNIKSFADWNAQFKKSKFENGKKIPGLNMTLLEFRKKIFRTEKKKETISFDQFKKGLKNWKSKKNLK